MKYIISEEELEILLRPHWSGTSTLQDFVKKYLKSKQSVEPGAELTGKQFEFRTIHEGDYIDYVRTKLYPKEINIKIYIQKVKESK